MRIYVVVCWRKPIIGDREIASVEVFSTEQAAEDHGSRFWDYEIFERDVLKKHPELQG